MASTKYEKLKRWRARTKKNKAYSPQYMKKRRAYYRGLYLRGKIAYADIPRSYRYFTDSRSAS